MHKFDAQQLKISWSLCSLIVSTPVNLHDAGEAEALGACCDNHNAPGSAGVSRGCTTLSVM